MNEQLLAATLKVLTNSQATLYAQIMRLEDGDKLFPFTDEQMQVYMDEYNEDTAKLIIEVMEATSEQG